MNDYLERCTSIAVLGGTFDPIHNGHISVAENVLHQFKPQKVLFIPSGNPPHKPDKPVSAAHHRYQMVLQAIGGKPGLEANRMEIDRQGASYTIDTIYSLKSLLAKRTTIYFVIGQDALENILTWKNPKELLKACEFITVPRPGCDVSKLNALIKMLEKKYDAVIHILKSPLLEISSTYIRKSIAKDKPVSALIPKEVESYIHSHGLYKAPTPNLSQEHFEWAKAKLKKHLTPKRFKHSLGVVIEAEKLAKHYGADIKKARWAALLHDTTKEYGTDKKRILCEKWGIQVDEVVAAHIDLAHGLLGAEAASRQYLVKDEEILQAIRYHILGHKNMTLLDKIIVLADFIEPYREDYYPLKEMQEHAYTDINKALLIGLTAMRDIDEKRGKTLHHWSKDAIETLKELIK